MDSFILGQYMPYQSPIHSLDPRSKLYLAVVTMVAVFTVKGLGGVVVTVLFTGLFIRLARVPLRLYWQGTRPLLIVVAITVAFQVFLVPGEIIHRWGIITITDMGVRMGALMAYRLIIVFILAELLTFTTTPLELTDGLERILQPGKRLGVPVHELAMIMTIALRFIPVFFEEGGRMAKAQISRGADLGGGGLKKARSLLAIMVPLLVRAFKRADDLALAMEARCYTGGEGRTRLHVLALTRADYGVMAAATGLMLLVILAGI